MTAEVCPYCRAPISAEDAATTCEGCAARHHADCYTENGGCTIFGCKYTPAEEPKLTVSTPGVVSVAHSAAAVATAPAVGAPPPPPRGVPATSLPQSPHILQT